MSIVYFICAILFICIAHMVRILRWELFIDVYEKPDRKNLMQALSYGYILNYFLPYKLGELVRAWYSGRKMKNGKALGVSTVIIDRYLDVVSVGIIFILITYLGIGNEISRRTALTYVWTSVILLVLAIVIYALKNIVKKIIRSVASIFNERIESAFLQFAWALIWNFKDIFQRISKIRMILATVCMWSGYLIAYYFFSCFLQLQGIKTTWVDVFFMLFAQNGIKEIRGGGTLLRSNLTVEHPIYMILYMVLPTIILFILSFVLRQSKEELLIDGNDYLRLLPHIDAKERLDFLENYFSGKNRLHIQNYLKINQGISIIRDYSAGSNATTMLCMDGINTFFRKYAFGDEGEKLYQQITWINENRDSIPLPQILKQEKTELYCYYDMPYSSSVVGLFEYAHSMPVEKTWTVISNALERLEDSIYKKGVKQADRKTIYQYVELKVQSNLKIIKNARRIKNLQQYDTIIINGIEYKNLQFYENYLTKEYLYNIFDKDKYSVIHGDLTIENIICERDNRGEDNFYIIDPNTQNIHDSSNLDYAKLLQSIHGGYEFLMSTRDIKITGNRIDFPFIKSATYIELHKIFRKYMLERLGENRTRSIYFHEIIHWLRLMPYKIEKDGKRALLFYAGMLMVMNDVIEMYSES